MFRPYRLWLKAIITAFLLAACAVPHPVCRHNALATAILYAEQGHAVRIAAYGIYNGNRHAEPQVKADGEWKYIKMDCEGNRVADEPDFEPRNIEYYGLHEYLLRIGVKPNF